MGTTGAHRLAGVRPVEQDRIRTPCDKIIQNQGSRGHAPLGCFPLRGREGVTLANFIEWIIQMISRENRILSDTMMGADAPIPPLR
jgi:hypothetical protein